MSVRRDLYAAIDAAGTILHKLLRPSAVPSADKVRNDQLRIGINSDPRPNVPPAFLFLLGTSVLRLRPNELPNFIRL